jgi:VIT1/CCC1 family predicted Fe2+/Mn2+ transporter
MDDLEKFPDLEILSLRKKIKELEQQLSQAQSVLREYDLLDAKSHISDEEIVLTRQISKMRELSDKNVPFTLEDVKVLEILVKTLLAVRGKAPVEEKRSKKKEEKPDVAKLLKIVEDGKKAND